MTLGLGLTGSGSFPKAEFPGLLALALLQRGSEGSAPQGLIPSHTGAALPGGWVVGVPMGARAARAAVAMGRSVLCLESQGDCPAVLCPSARPVQVSVGSSRPSSFSLPLTRVSAS